MKGKGLVRGMMCFMTRCAPPFPNRCAAFLQTARRCKIPVTIQQSKLASTNSYQLKGYGQSCAANMKTNTNHTLCTDIPKSMGGKDSAPQPVEHLLAAYIGCTQATALFVGRNMKPRVLIDKIEFDIVGHRDERGALDDIPITDQSPLPQTPARLASLTGSIRVFSKDRLGQEVAIGEGVIRLLEKHVEHRCPVANMMILSGCQIHVLWEDGFDTKASTDPARLV
eukprot:scaffold3411_cov190-Chaetoceros_neogracile.AAC.8